MRSKVRSAVAKEAAISKSPMSGSGGRRRVVAESVRCKSAFDTQPA